MTRCTEYHRPSTPPSPSPRWRQNTVLLTASPATPPAWSQPHLRPPGSIAPFMRTPPNLAKVYQVRLDTNRMYSRMLRLKNLLTLCHLSQRKLVTVGCLQGGEGGIGKE